MERFTLHTWAVNNFMLATSPMKCGFLSHFHPQLLPGLQAKPELTAKQLNPALS